MACTDTADQEVPLQALLISDLLTPFAGQGRAVFHAFPGPPAFDSAKAWHA